MRPVNLIPPEDRRGDRAPTRTGPLAYILVGALAAGLAAVTAVVLTNNQIADRTEEVASLEAQEASARQRAEALAPYAEFAALKDARVQTVDSLSRSRFDWERVLRELALVIPPGIQLTNVTGTVAPEVTVDGGATSMLREDAPGPALVLAGCADRTETVAELTASLEDIDGVTRVGVSRSTATDSDGGGGASPSAGSGSTTGCDTDQRVYQFEMVAAFDQVVVAAAAPASGAPAPTPASSETPASGGTPEQETSRDSAAEQTEKAKDAAGLVPGVAR